MFLLLLLLLFFLNRSSTGGCICDEALCAYGCASSSQCCDPSSCFASGGNCTVCDSKLSNACVSKECVCLKEATFPNPACSPPLKCISSGCCCDDTADGCTLGSASYSCLCGSQPPCLVSEKCFGGTCCDSTLSDSGSEGECFCAGGPICNATLREKCLYSEQEGRSNCCGPESDILTPEGCMCNAYGPSPCPSGYMCTPGGCVCDPLSCSKGCTSNGTCCDLDASSCFAQGSECVVCNQTTANGCLDRSCVCMNPQDPQAPPFPECLSSVECSAFGCCCDPILANDCLRGGGNNTACLCGVGPSCDPNLASACDIVSQTCKCGSSVQCSPPYRCLRSVNVSEPSNCCFPNSDTYSVAAGCTCLANGNMECAFNQICTPTGCVCNPSFCSLCSDDGRTCCNSFPDCGKSGAGCNSCNASISNFCLAGPTGPECGCQTPQKRVDFGAACQGSQTCDFGCICSNGGCGINCEICSNNNRTDNCNGTSCVCGSAPECSGSLTNFCAEGQCTCARFSGQSVVNETCRSGEDFVLLLFFYFFFIFFFFILINYFCYFLKRRFLKDQVCDQSFTLGCQCISGCGPSCVNCSGSETCFNSSGCCDPNTSDFHSGTECMCGSGSACSVGLCVSGICTQNTIIISCNQPSSVAYGVFYSSDMGVTGCQNNCTSVSLVSPPDGMMFSGGVLSGVAAFPSLFSFTVSVSDGAGFSQLRVCSLEVTGSPLALNCSNLQFLVDSFVPVALVATGGVEPYIYSGSKDLPPSLVLEAAGTFVGLPTVTGPFTFSVTVTDSFPTPTSVVAVCDGFVSAPPVLGCPAQLYADQLIL